MSDEEFLNTIQEYNLEIKNLIENYKLTKDYTHYRKVLINLLVVRIIKMRRTFHNWAKEELPKAYWQGVDEAFNRISKVQKVNKTTQTTKLTRLIGDTQSKTLEATVYVGQLLQDELIKVAKEVKDKGLTAKQGRERFIQKATKTGVVFRDKRGRRFSLDSYADMIARTARTQATNNGVVQQSITAKRDLVQLSSHAGACPICIPFEGRVYSISGRTKGYPKLSEAFSNGYSTIHPNCRHILEPYIVEYDENAEETKKNSSRPFELEKKDKARVERYTKDQKLKSERRRDRVAYEKAKLENPETTAKTFAGYRTQRNAKLRNG